MRVCRQCTRRFDDHVEFCHDDGAKLSELGDASGPPVPTSSDEGTNSLFPPHQDPLQPGTTVGEYVVEKQIGAGGMGVIFSAVHPVIGKKVAIKLLHPTMAHNPDVVQRFVTEAKAVNQIGHRNIVDIFAFGVLADGRHYFVMEFLDGESLAQRLQRAPMTAEQAFPIWVQAASAIEAAHAHGIIHRDLKPDNIFLCPSADGPFVKVLDFGIAKLMSNSPGGVSMTSTGAPMGTPLYMSPEQATGAKNIDHRTDLYAFGIILYETICGRPPFRGNTYIEVLSAQIATEHQPLSEQLPVNVELERIVDQLMHKDPDGRPPGMTAARGRLVELRDRMLAGEHMWGDARNGAVAPPLKAPKKKPVAGGSNKALPIIGGILLVSVAAVAVVVTRRAPPSVVEVTQVTPPPVVPTSTPMARVVVSTNSPKTQVFVDRRLPDGTLEMAKTPTAAGGMMVKLQVPPDVDLVLRIEGEGYKPSTQPLKLAAGEETALPVVLVPVAAPVVVSTAATKSILKHVALKPADPTKPPPPKPTTNSNLMDY